jgi:ubiquinone/menaquinone biosynthesis C-methylase UbiE
MEFAMKPIKDPERAELNQLVAACPLTGKQIGCGDGALTFQYARMAQGVVGIDPERSDLLVAKRKARFSTSFIQCEGEGLPLPSQVFNIVIFASSL